MGRQVIVKIIHDEDTEYAEVMKSPWRRRSMLRPSVEVRVALEITLLDTERALTLPALPNGGGKKSRWFCLGSKNSLAHSDGRGKR